MLGPIPAKLAQGFCDLYNLMNVEMPTGEIELEEGRRTAEVQTAQEEELLQQGRTRLTVLAYSPAGEAVAYSNIVTGASDSDDPGVDQWATIVRPDHRGHRLGLAVKCALTRAVQEHFPDAAVKLTGGVVYQLALNDVLSNFTADDGELLERLLLLDDQCVAAGQTHYAVAVATH